MKQLRHISLLTFLALLIASCNKESIDANSPQQGAASITIALSETAISRADVVGDPNENHINELKIFIFDATTTTLEKVIKIDPKNPMLGDDKWNNTTKTLVIKDLPNPTLSRTVYVIANWITDDAKLAAITNEAMLLEQFTELTGQIATPTEALPLVMSGKATHTFSTQKALTVSVKRQVAKIKLTVSIDSKFADKFPTTTFGDIGSEHAKVELRNAPNRSYVCEQAVPSVPAGSKMLRYTPVAMTQTGTTSADMSWTTTFYVYENIANGADNQMATYLSLQMPYQDGANAVKTDNYYKFSINTSDITNPHVTLRNKFYNMSAKVMGFGDAVATPANAEVFTEVLDWNGISVDAGALGDDYVVFQSTDIPTTTIPSGGGLYKLKCKSKLGRWGVKVTNGDGVVVGGSVADVDATSGFGETLAPLGEQELSVVILPNTSNAQALLNVQVYCDGYAREIKNFTSTQPYRQLVVDPTSGHLSLDDNGVAKDLGFKANSLVGVLSSGKTEGSLIAGGDIVFEPFGYVARKVAAATNSTAMMSAIPSVENAVLENNIANVKRSMGDPCKLVGLTTKQILEGVVDNKTWRLPTNSEYNNVEIRYTGVPDILNSAPGDPWYNDGTATVGGKKMYSFLNKDRVKINLHASGNRRADGSIYAIDNMGYYLMSLERGVANNADWEGRSYGIFHFKPSGDAGAGAPTRYLTVLTGTGRAFPIRCVKQ